MKARFIFENETLGLDNFLNTLEEKFPETKNYRENIENFILQSDCKRIELEDLGFHVAGMALADRVIMNIRSFHNMPFVLYATLHEAAHQYQYKKYGAKEMYKFYFNDVDIEQVAKDMQHYELVADNYAIKKCKDFVRMGLLKENEVPKSVYKTVPIDHFKEFISKIREAVKENGITDQSDVSEFLYNYLKNMAISR